MNVTSKVLSDETLYHLPEGYQENLHPVPYVATVEKSNWYQVEVYRLAALLLSQMEGLKKVLDLGCGMGTKLSEFIVPLKDVGFVFGVDISPFPDDKERLSLRSMTADLSDPGFSLSDWEVKVPFQRWTVRGFQGSETTLRCPESGFDMVICSDVIEHVQDPLNLLDHIQNNMAEGALVVISTPCRDAWGVGASGPPNNHFHVREWSGPEFHKLLTGFGFEVLSFPLLAEGRDPTGAKTCQTAVVKKK